MPGTRDLADEAEWTSAARHLPAQKPPPLKVLKFGSSVLRSTRDLPRVAGEIYRQSRAGERVIAIVSALGDETDELLAACNEAAGETRCSGIAEAVSLGEEKTAALLRIACDRIGLGATVCRPEEAGIITTGDLLEATPVRISAGFGKRIERTRDVLIVPGYVGIDGTGARSLLGRGGSDFSAIFIAGESGADIVRLYKDVDGVFDHDPSLGGEDLHRFDQVSWSDCLTLARPLLQPRAVEYARSRRLDIEVGAIGSDRPTLVSDRTASPRRSSPAPPLRIALAGFGTVGQALCERLGGEPDFEIAAILVRDTAKPRRVEPPVPLTSDAQRFAATPCDILIDLTCGEETGLALCRDALDKGIHVVSANKLVIGKNLDELGRIAARRGASLLHSATVGGSAPILETVGLARATSPVERVTAVLNGTVNFLLDQLASGVPFEQALARAQQAGFAEEDPAQDLSGEDAALKLRIVAASLGSGLGRDIAISVEPLDEKLIATIAQSGERWLQVSSLVNAGGTLFGSVSLKPAAEVADFDPPSGERSLVHVRCANGETRIASGRGAGGAATAEALAADLFDIRRAHKGAAQHVQLEEQAELPPLRAKAS